MLNTNTCNNSTVYKHRTNETEFLDFDRKT